MAKSRQARRGASRSSRKKQARRQVPGWVWLFTGVIIGLFVAFLVHLSSVPVQPGMAADTTQETDSQGQQASESDTSKQPKFDFYAVLPKMEVIAPKSKEADQATTDARKNKTTPDSRPKVSATKPAKQEKAGQPSTSTSRYMLQAGSFRQNSDADKRRAALTLKGFHVNIQPVQLDNGETWHRVMVGPYTTLALLHKAQDKLVADGIETLPIRIKDQ